MGVILELLEGNQVVHAANLQDTEALALRLAREIESVPRLILILDGEMGAGKTQFCRFLMEALEVGDLQVASPSFSIHNTYDSKIGAIEHIDLYRITNEDDLESTGFWDLFIEKPRLVVIEWGDRLREMGLLTGLPKSWPRLQVTFKINGLSEREFLFQKLL